MKQTAEVWLDRPAARWALSAVAVACALIGLWARFWHLGSIKTPIFDEVYFPVFASAFLHRTVDFDVHPPLGKFLLAIGIHFFGDDPFGWRIVPAVFGIVNVALLLWIFRLLGGTGIGRWILLPLISLDGMLIVYSRTGLIDGILLAMILLTFALASRVEERGSLVPLAISLGLACDVKWIGIGVIAPVLYMLWRRGRLGEFLLHLPLSLIVYYLVTVAGQAVGRIPDPWLAAWTWHLQAWQYQTTLTATHPYASKWWSWPLELRPVLFYYTAVPGGTSVIIAMSNPVLWGAADLAVLASLASVFRRMVRQDAAVFDSPLMPLLIGYFVFWLPFALISRVLFLYHYLPAYAMALLMLAYWLERLWKRQPWLVIAIVAVLTATSLYFLPFAIGTPLSALWLSRHVWYYHWIY